jgi:hypothetical protein
MERYFQWMTIKNHDFFQWSTSTIEHYERCNINDGKKMGWVTSDLSTINVQLKTIDFK